MNSLNELGRCHFVVVFCTLIIKVTEMGVFTEARNKVRHELCLRNRRVMSSVPVLDVHEVALEHTMCELSFGDSRTVFGRCSCDSACRFTLVRLSYV